MGITPDRPAPRSGMPSWARPVVRAAGTAVAVPTLAALRRTGLETRTYRRVFRRMRDGEWNRDPFGGYRPTAADVIVACWMKSGTSWMLQIATQVAWRGRGDFAHIHDVVPWPDSPLPFGVGLDAAPAAPDTGLRVIKTHLPADRVPWSADARYVTVIRDPKDVFVSSWHFFRDFLAGPLMPSPAAWLDLFCSHDFVFGSWPAHVAGWWALRDRPNVAVVGFADLKADLAAGVDRVAALLGVDLTASERAAVLHLAGFPAMRALDERFRPPDGSPFAARRRMMMRRGQAGVADELLDAAGCRRIDRWCADELARVGSDFPYDAWFGPHS